MQSDVKPDVVIMTPTHSGDVCASYAVCLAETIALLGQAGYSCQPVLIMGNAIISFARAVGLKRFMDLGAEHFFMIDADLRWDAQSVVRMVKSPHDFVAGIYPAKTPDHEKVFQTRNLRECVTQNYVETDGVPGGFVRVKRSAIQKMIDAYPELTKFYKVDKATGQRTKLHYLFENILMEDMPLGEDYAFCERWRQLDGKIFIDPAIDFTHFGRGEWHGNMLEDDKRLQAV